MATQTVVCPECGSPTAPGRYTCNECGAFLDGVAVAPRAWAPVPADPAPAPDAGLAPAEPPDADVEEPEVPATQAAISPDDVLPPADDLLLEDGPALDPVDPTLPPPPDVLHDVQWPSPEDRLPPTLAPAASAAPVGLMAEPPRMPAGAWMPPSGLLTGLDDGADGTGAAGSATSATVAGSPSAASGPAGRDWLAILGPADRRWATARRTIAVGSAVTLLGFLLPWVSTSVSSILGIWTSVWGLAGAGHWLILLGVAALGIAAASSGRAASVPLGMPAVVAGSFLLGLIWPSLLGSGRPIGILVVLVGAVVLAVGGILQLGARHEAATPDV